MRNTCVSQEGKERGKNDEQRMGLKETEAELEELYYVICNLVPFRLSASGRNKFYYYYCCSP